MARTWFQRLALTGAVLAFGVVTLGAYVRLSDAGLGCPDWPGCYGHLDVPAGHEIAAANAAYPERPVEAGKAWREMVHRYLAGTLGLLVLALAIIAWRRRREPDQPVALPLVLLALVIFQALLGMWTVTWLLKPVIVMAHLLGGFATVALLWWLALRPPRTAPLMTSSGYRSLRFWAFLGLILVVGQTALGGWTSANYAALACPDFPTCQTQWWPPMDFKEAFVLWRGLGMSYEGGVLDNNARVAIHVTHRLGALVVLAYLIWLAWRVFRVLPGGPVRDTALFMLLLVVVQVSLGIANVLFQLPMAVAVAHNGVAALLVLTLATLNYFLRPREA